MVEEYLIQLHPQRLRNSLRNTTLFLLAQFALGIFLTMILSAAKVGMVLFLIELPLLAFTAFHFFYLLRLNFAKRSELYIHGEGLDDSLSPLRFGIVQRSELRKLRIVRMPFLGRCLEVRLRSSAQSWENRSGFRERMDGLYRFIFGTSVYIPISILSIGVEELKAVLALYKGQGSADEPEAAQSGPEPSMASDLISGALAQQPTFEGPQLPYEVGLDAEELAPVKLSPQLESMARQIVVLYSDILSQFPDWQRERDPRLPANVTELEYGLKDASEFLEFIWQDVRFRFVRDLTVTDHHAPLSVYADEELKMRVILQVEIGTYEYLSTESLVGGSWFDHLSALNQVVCPPVLKKKIV